MLYPIARSPYCSSIPPAFFSGKKYATVVLSLQAGHPTQKREAGARAWLGVTAFLASSVLQATLATPQVHSPDLWGLSESSLPKGL
jgi:hypothetical protein